MEPSKLPYTSLSLGPDPPINVPSQVDLVLEAATKLGSSLDAGAARRTPTTGGEVKVASGVVYDLRGRVNTVQMHLLQIAFLGPPVIPEVDTRAVMDAYIKGVPRSVPDEVIVQAAQDLEALFLAFEEKLRVMRETRLAPALGHVISQLGPGSSPTATKETSSQAPAPAQTCTPTTGAAASQPAGPPAPDTPPMSCSSKPSSPTAAASSEDSEAGPAKSQPAPQQDPSSSTPAKASGRTNGHTLSKSTSSLHPTPGSSASLSAAASSTTSLSSNGRTLPVNRSAGFAPHTFTSTAALSKPSGVSCAEVNRSPSDMRKQDAVKLYDMMIDGYTLQRGEFLSGERRREAILDSRLNFRLKDDMITKKYLRCLQREFPEMVEGAIGELEYRLVTMHETVRDVPGYMNVALQTFCTKVGCVPQGYKPVKLQ